MDKKNSVTPTTTITRDVKALASHAGNIYETVVIIAKRANQISADLKKELEQKLQEYRSFSDSLEEVHENQEQIEISRYYEKLPKPSLRAIKEFEDGEVYYRNPLKTTDLD